MIARSLVLLGFLSAASPLPAQPTSPPPPAPGLGPAAPAAQDGAPAAPPAVPVTEEKDKLKTQADEAYRKQDYAKAIEILDQIIKETPNDHVALYLRASAKVELGAEQGKGDLIRNGITDSINAVKAEGKSRPDYYLPYFYGMSQLSALENTLEHARSARGVADGMLKQPLQGPERSQILYQRALLSLQMKEPVPAKADLEESVKLVADNMAAWMALADVTARQDGVDKGLEVFRQAIEKHPSDPMLLNNRGMFLQSQGRDSEAVADFTRAYEIDPKFTVALANRGLSLLNQSQFEAAEADLTKAMEGGQLDRGILSLRSAVRMNLNRVDDAIRDSEAGVKLEPENPLAHADLGFAQFAAKDYAGALKSLDEAQRLGKELPFLLPWRYAAAKAAGAPIPADADAAIKKGKEQRNWFESLTAYQAGQVTEGDLKQLIDAAPEPYRDPEKCEANCFIGLKALAAGNKDAAKRAFQQSLTSKATSLSAYRVARAMASGL